MDLVLIAHNIRSSHNVGSLLRTADGMGVTTIYLTGYTPHPKTLNDERPPYIIEKIEKQIHKTALGAESFLNWHYAADVYDVVDALKSKGFRIIALEQTKSSVALHEYKDNHKTAIIIGNEVTGVDPELLAQCSTVIEIPMLGKKESLNVVQATAILLYHMRFGILNA